jgi:hypothetical protein
MGREVVTGAWTIAGKRLKDIKKIEVAVDFFCFGETV